MRWAPLAVVVVVEVFMYSFVNNPFGVVNYNASKWDIWIHFNKFNLICNIKSLPLLLSISPLIPLLLRLWCLEYILLQSLLWLEVVGILEVHLYVFVLFATFFFHHHWSLYLLYLHGHRRCLWHCSYFHLFFLLFHHWNISLHWHCLDILLCLLCFRDIHIKQ